MSSLRHVRPVSVMSLLLLATTITTTSALPVRRQANDPSADSSVQTVSDYMEIALQTFLAGQQGISNFHALSGGWKPIDFAGTGSSLTTEMSANSAFYMADQLFVPTPISYSQMMIDFIQQINIDMNLNSSTSGVNKPDVKAAAVASSAACFAGMQKAVSEVSKAYSDFQGGALKNTNDPEFLQFAAQDSVYQQASAECQSASNAYQAKLSAAVGKDFYIFSGALNTISQILTPTEAVAGITMDVSDETAAPGKNSGKVKPYYSFPTLNGTLSSWQSPDKSGLAPSFTWNSSTVSGSTTNTSSSGGAGVSFIWEDVSGSGSGGTTDTKSATNTTAVGMDISFGQISMFGVEYGLWNSPEVASALQKPSDAVAQKGAQAFKDYYGTADKPGPLASWKDQALVVYQPSFSVQFSTSEEAADFHQSAGSASACILFICIGGHGSSSTNTTSYQQGSKVVTFKDTSNQAYLVGFTETTYYPNQGVQDANNWNVTTNTSQDTDSSSSTGNSTANTDSSEGDETSNGDESSATAEDGTSDATPADETSVSTPGDDTSDTTPADDSSTEDEESGITSGDDSTSDSSSTPSPGDTPGDEASTATDGDTAANEDDEESTPATDDGTTSADDDSASGNEDDSDSTSTDDNTESDSPTGEEESTSPDDETSATEGEGTTSDESSNPSTDDETSSTDSTSDDSTSTPTGDEDENTDSPTDGETPESETSPGSGEGESTGSPSADEDTPTTDTESTSRPITPAATSSARPTNTTSTSRSGKPTTSAAPTKTASPGKSSTAAVTTKTPSPSKPGTTASLPSSTKPGTSTKTPTSKPPPKIQSVPQVNKPSPKGKPSVKKPRMVRVRAGSL
ncbi:hypothetical protein GYMLUDRAFT_237104 [Collybiopsis luxurians FD-317 M1]|nr:hypothetical protein GYMLUDRAFT_237104 [Collybiopsis luxurians FD-317 M1]